MRSRNVLSCLLLMTALMVLGTAAAFARCAEVRSKKADMWDCNPGRAEEPKDCRFLRSYSNDKETVFYVLWPESSMWYLKDIDNLNHLGWIANKDVRIISCPERTRSSRRRR
jgi:hypothetical protein